MNVILMVHITISVVWLTMRMRIALLIVPLLMIILTQLFLAQNKLEQEELAAKNEIQWVAQIYEVWVAHFFDISIKND